MSEFEDIILTALIFVFCAAILIAIQLMPTKHEEVPQETIKATPAEYNAEPPVLEQKHVWFADDTPIEDEADDQFEELVQIVMAEGGNTEPEMGLRLICDSILNRVDDSRFPNTIHDVIYQKGQFQPVGDGVLYRFTPTEKVIQICAQEVQHRTNSKVLFFRTKCYHAETTHIAHIGNHFYSGK